MRLTIVARWICAGLLSGMMFGPTIARADDDSAPERLLAADSILYWRFDGWTPHQAAFNKTAFADVLRGGTTEFLEYYQHFAGKELSDRALGQSLLAGKRVGELKILHSAAKQVPLLWPAIEQRGVVVGIEASGKRQSPRLTIVLPQGKPLYLVARLLANQFSDAPVERQIKGRLALVSEPQSLGGATTNQTADAAPSNSAHNVKSPTANAANPAAKVAAPTPATHVPPKTSAKPAEEPTRMLAWSEGNDLVIVVAAETSDEMVGSVLDRRERNLLDSPLYKEAAAFKDYETLSNGFVDFQPAIREIAKMFGLGDLPKIMAALGLDGVQQVLWHSGVEGRHQRYTIDFIVPGERKGILRMLDGVSLAADKLPPLPSDLDQFHLFCLQPDSVCDVLRTSAYAIAEIFDDDSAKAVLATDKSFRSATKQLGIDLQRDLFDSLGPRLLIYNSPSEGPLFAGAGVALQVKNPVKLQKAMAHLGKLAASGGEYQFVHLNRRGIDMMSLREATSNTNTLGININPFTPSFAIHDGWLVMALNPQTVDGFILRSASRPPSFSLSQTDPARAPGTYQSWQPSPLLRQVVAKAARHSPQLRILSIHESDPRPFIKFGLSFAPLLGSIMNSSFGEKYDNRLIPNTQSIVEPLYPNVSIVCDDGRRVRFDGYKSAPFPLDSSFSIVVAAAYFIF